MNQQKKLAGESSVDAPLRYLVKIDKPIERPKTPTIMSKYFYIDCHT